MLRFVVDNLKEKLKKLLSTFPSAGELTWEKGFEDFSITRGEEKEGSRF